MLTLDEREQNTHRAEHSRADVGDCDTDAHGALAGQSRNRHQAAHPLRDLIYARAVAVGTVLAEAGDAAIDQARIDRAEALVVDTEPMLHVGAVVFDDHVGALDESFQDCDSLRLLKIEGHALLVAMEILEVGAIAARDVPTFAGFLDLEDIGAPVGELTRRGRPGARAR